LRRIVRIIVVAVFVATILVVSSVPAFARPRFGGVELSQTKVCEKLAEDHPRFEWRTEGGERQCWHISPGLTRDS